MGKAAKTFEELVMYQQNRDSSREGDRCTTIRRLFLTGFTGLT